MGMFVGFRLGADLDPSRKGGNTRPEADIANDLYSSQ